MEIKPSPLQKTLKKQFIISFVGIFFFAWIAIRFLDQPLAFVVSNLHHHGWRLYDTDSFNVFITELVYFISLFSMSLYVICRYLHIEERWVGFTGRLALAMTISFFIKTQLQFLFGRKAPCFEIYSSHYIPHPMFYGFQWFTEGSFPSGHMLIFTSLLLWVTFYYPKTSRFCYTLLTILALLLIVDNYHYLSDVIVGGYIGLWIAIITKYIFRVD